MTLAALKEAPPDTVEAVLRYSIRTDQKPVSETYGPGAALSRRYTGTFNERKVTIESGRPLRDALQLDVSGFELVDHSTKMHDFFDKGALRNLYYLEMERLIAERSGASRVHVFDHTLRSGDEGTRETRQIREPVKSVHNDYTEWSGPQRVRDLLPNEAETLLKQRFAIVQVWRPINKPVERDPLTIADSRSIAQKDFIAAERRFPDRVGEIYQLEYSPAHRWYWFPSMTRDEAIVFKVYDSAKDGRARWGGHTSFDNPLASPDAGPRESIEIRAFAFF